jgi:hypothetical protein
VLAMSDKNGARFANNNCTCILAENLYMKENIKIFLLVVIVCQLGFIAYQLMESHKLLLWIWEIVFKYRLR